MKTPKEKIASFDVDCQKGFTPLCPDELPIVGGDEIADDLNFMATLASYRIGSKDAHSPNALWVVDSHDKMLQPTGLVNADLTWVIHCVPGTKGYDLLDGLPAENEYDLFILKGMEVDLHPYGACFHDIAERISTGVIEALKERGYTTVLLGGLALDKCVKSTAIQLAKAGLRVVLYLPASRALGDVDLALAEMAEYGVLFASDQNSLKVLAQGTEENNKIFE